MNFQLQIEKKRKQRVNVKNDRNYGAARNSSLIWTRNAERRKAKLEKTLNAQLSARP